jgi:hypothetical protein
MTFYFLSLGHILSYLWLFVNYFDSLKNDAGLSADWNFGAEARSMAVRCGTA